MVHVNSDIALRSAISTRWILGIDTSTEQAGLAVSSGDKTVVRSWTAGRTQTTSVLPAIDELLREADMTIRDVHAIAVAVGPGTFTGLRVGVSIAKGLVMAMDIPLIGIPTLDITAAAAGDEEGLIAVLPAGRGRVVWQHYGPVVSSQPRNTTIPELIEALAEMPNPLVIGELGEDHQAMIERVYAHVRWEARRPEAMIHLASEHLDRGAMDDPVTLEPTYLHGVTVSTRLVQDRLRRKE